MAYVTLGILDLHEEVQQQSNICSLNLVPSVEILEGCVKPLTLLFNAGGQQYLQINLLPALLHLNNNSSSVFVALPYVILMLSTKLEVAFLRQAQCSLQQISQDMLLSPGKLHYLNKAHGRNLTGDQIKQ